MSRFAVNVNDFSTEAALLPTNYYAAEICNAGITYGKNPVTYSINVAKDQEWDNEAKAFKDKGTYSLQGNFNFGVKLLSKKALDILKRDEVRFFGGRIRLTFNAETGVLENNHVLRNFFDALGITDIDFNERVVYEEDQDIHVPDEIADMPNAVDLLNACMYYREYFDQVAQEINGLQCQVSILKQQNKKNPAVQENVINLGDMRQPFCGIVKYEEGCEDDLEG